MTNPIPVGMEGIIPHLVCSPCLEAINFYKKAFGAIEHACMMAPDGQRVMHAQLEINGHPVFLVDDFPEYCGGKSGTAISLGGTPVTLHHYVTDCDAAIQRAADAGAKVVMPAQEMFWGDRYGLITDPYGHNWSIATHTRDLTPEQTIEGMNQAFAQG